MAVCEQGNCGPAGLATAGQDGQPPLQSLLECPVCHEVAQPPIFTCIGSHHMFCAECRAKVQICPLCKTSICDQRCLFAEQCMEHMRLPCKNYHEGCKAILKGTEYRAHLNTCPFRPIECFISRCGKKIPFFQYFDHIKEAHRNKVNGIDDCNKHIVEWWIEGDPAATARWPPYYFTCFNQVFLYMAISTVHGMWEWVWIIGNDEDAKRFRVISRVENVEKMAELTWKGAVHSIRKSVHEIVSSGLAFVTNSKELRNPYLFRKSGEGSRYFWRTDVEIVEVEPPPPGAMMYLETKEGSKKTGSKKPTGSIHSTTEAPEIIGNTAGKGFMRQSGPNSLTPSQIINLEEEHRDSNMVGKASLINQQDITALKTPPMFENQNAQQFPMPKAKLASPGTNSGRPDNPHQWAGSMVYDGYSMGLAPEPTESPPILQQNTHPEKQYQQRPPQEKGWESYQYEMAERSRNQTAVISPKTKTPIKSPYGHPDNLPNLNSLLQSYDTSKSPGVMSPGGNSESDGKPRMGQSFQPSFGMHEQKNPSVSMKDKQGGANGGAGPDSNLSFSSDTTPSGQSINEYN
ncbi:unnamed protein product [Allacma fusca]|uniref:RING-type E3 ubiquitin transferase n=1 Tax=Allacma fusca TaxID=39272 RepID=A0A8J2JD39_9HEXA|nr:unnamed protein product [Allacma fusca]